MKVLALILAGGTGTRLGVLTETLAKPSVYFGGKYRIIDFALSNCAHSQLEGIAILPQYRPVELISHVAMGRPWDFVRKNVLLRSASPSQRVVSRYSGCSFSEH